MGLLDPFGGGSSSSSRTTNNNRQVTLSDQAVNLVNTNSGNTTNKNDNSVKVGNNSTINSTTTVTNGLAKDDFASIIGGLGGTLGSAISNLKPQTTSTPVGSGTIDPVTAAAMARANEQIETGGEVAKDEAKGTLPTSVWIAIGAGVLLLFGAAFFKRKKK